MANRFCLLRRGSNRRSCTNLSLIHGVHRGSQGIPESTQAQETVASTFRGESYSEFDALIIHSAFSQREKRFDFGGGFYNGLISTMVPRQWVGEQFKTSLMLDLHTGDFKNPGSSYGWEMPYGSNPTGVLQAFNEFWFFGALLYFGLSWWLARVWWRASRGDCLHQAAYALLAPWALVAIAGAWSTAASILADGCLFMARQAIDVGASLGALET